MRPWPESTGRSPRLLDLPCGYGRFTGAAPRAGRRGRDLRSFARDGPPDAGAPGDAGSGGRRDAGTSVFGRGVRRDRLDPLLPPSPRARGPGRRPYPSSPGRPRAGRSFRSTRRAACTVPNGGSAAFSARAGRTSRCSRRASSSAKPPRPDSKSPASFPSSAAFTLTTSPCSRSDKIRSGDAGFDPVPYAVLAVRFLASRAAYQSMSAPTAFLAGPSFVG